MVVAQHGDRPLDVPKLHPPLPGLPRPQREAHGAHHRPREQAVARGGLDGGRGRHHDQRGAREQRRGGHDEADVSEGEVLELAVDGGVVHREEQQVAQAEGPQQHLFTTIAETTGVAIAIDTAIAIEISMSIEALCVTTGVIASVNLSRARTVSATAVAVAMVTGTAIGTEMANKTA